jgi:hypothetical protein
MRRAVPAAMIREMAWTVTTQGELPDDHEHRAYDAAVQAWLDYWGRILELEIHSYALRSEEVVQYGRRWACNLLRGPERLTVTIERTA